MSASSLLAALIAATLAAPSGADDPAGRPPARIARMPRGIDVSPADRQRYAMMMVQSSAGAARALREAAAVPPATSAPRPNR